MDTPSEDTMVRQIEKNLSNQMNENLFIDGRNLENKPVVVNRYSVSTAKNATSSQEGRIEYPLVSHDYISNTQEISRAEYIRQAREACLRQLSSVQLYSKPYEVNYMEQEPSSEEQLAQKKARVMKLFPDQEGNEIQPGSEGLIHENLKFRSLILRSVCAVIIFISIFLLDKFKIDIGSFSHSVIRDYVTGNDALKQLESIIVTWLK